MQNLTPHHNNQPSDHSVQVNWRKFADRLEVTFVVTAYVRNIHQEYDLERYDNEGLWNYDVVEVFVQGEGDVNEYLEIQVSPLGQKFALYIHEPRVKTTHVTKLKSTAEAYDRQVGWDAKFVIYADEIPGDFSKLRANFFACLGNHDYREYYALNINKEEFPDFHRPELFEEIR